MTDGIGFVLGALALIGAWIFIGQARAAQEQAEARTELARNTSAVLGAQLAAQEAQAHLLESLMATIDRPVFLVDNQLRLQRWNPVAAALFTTEGRRPEAGLRLTDSRAGFQVIELIQRALQTGEPATAEIHWGRTPDAIYELRVQPLAQGGETRVLAVLIDRASSVAFDELRREFVTNVTHELKTPLTNISGAAETLIDGAGDDPVHRGRFLDIIQRNAEQLRSLIEDLLIIARSEEPAPAGEIEHCDYRSVRELMLSDLARTADASEVAFLTQPLPGPVVLRLPGTDCYTILKNITENAIRYNKPGGSVTFTERLLPEWLELSIRDTGEGIAATDLPRIFERFYRADKQRSRAQGGTGLGLAIVKNLMERHGGTVEVQSEAGLGTTFVLRLPLGNS